MKLLKISIFFCLFAYLCAGRSIRDRFEIGLVKSPAQAAKLLSESWDDDAFLIESFVVMLLDKNDRLIQIMTIEKGSDFHVQPDGQQIAAAADMAHKIIVAHNHPSFAQAGPSDADINATVYWKEKLKGKLMDHIILPGWSDKYYSFAEAGRLPDGYQH